MKYINAMLCVGALLMTNSVHADQVSADDMKMNFKACTENSPNWTERWGQYIVGFDIYTAQANCSRIYGSRKFNVRTAGCSVEGTWKTAGYYCEEIERR